MISFLILREVFEFLPLPHSDFFLPSRQCLPTILWCAAPLRALRCATSGQFEGEPHLGASENAGSQ